MLKNNFSDYLIAAKGSTLTGHALVLELWLPWYRSLPLSVVEVVEVLLDDGLLDLSDAELELNGQRFPLRALPDLTGEVWFVQDSAYLHVPLSSAAKAGGRRLEAQVNLYPPYIPMLTWVTRSSITLEQGA